MERSAGDFVVLSLRTVVRAIPIRLLAVLSCLSIGGCALLPGTHFVNGETPYYIEGPHQQGPPDGFLPIGTEVRVESEQGSYSRIWTKSGIHAYVWSPALKTRAEWLEQEKQ